MNLLMADHARAPRNLVAVGGVVQQKAFVDRRRMPRGDVAPLAQVGQLGLEHSIVVRAVRVMAGHTSIRDGRVFPQIRTALFRVAARAALVDGRTGLQQPNVG